MFPGFETASMVLAVALSLYIGYLTAVRIMGESTDPSASVSASSDTGSFTFLLSGAWLVFGSLAVVAALTWPLVVENTVIGGLFVGIIIAHIIVERRERS